MLIREKFRVFPGVGQSVSRQPMHNGRWELCEIRGVRKLGIDMRERKEDNKGME